MSRLSHLKLGFALAGLILWGYGVRAEVEWLRWTGIAFLAASAILRFFGPRSSRRSPYEPTDDSKDQR
jgi:hypothetical protein